MIDKGIRKYSVNIESKRKHRITRRKKQNNHRQRFLRPVPVFQKGFVFPLKTQSSWRKAKKRTGGLRHLIPPERERNGHIPFHQKKKRDSKKEKKGG